MFDLKFQRNPKLQIIFLLIIFQTFYLKQIFPKTRMILIFKVVMFPFWYQIFNNQQINLFSRSNKLEVFTFIFQIDPKESFDNFKRNQICLFLIFLTGIKKNSVGSEIENNIKSIADCRQATFSVFLYFQDEESCFFIMCCLIHLSFC